MSFAQDKLEQASDRSSFKPKAEGNFAKLRTVAMTLRGAKTLREKNRDAIELDARMAAEVTEILRRVVAEELV